MTTKQLESMKRTYHLRLFVFLVAAALCPHWRVSAQEIERTIRKQFLFYPGFRFCNPAEVKGFGLGKQPLEVMLAQVYVQSRSEKAISAIKLSWKVYDYVEGMRIATSQCEPPVAPLAFLSGGTDFIDLKELPPKETTIIGIDPLPVLRPGERTIFVARPFLKVDDVKPVINNEKSEGRKYLVVLYVSEIRFADGTEWAMKQSSK
jgi:hypothetical protein